MRKNNTKTSQKESIKVKQSPFWYFAWQYLQYLEDFNVIMEDKEFIRLYRQLMAYVEEKISLPGNGDILDAYMVIELEPDPK